LVYPSFPPTLANVRRAIRLLKNGALSNKCTSVPFPKAVGFRLAAAKSVGRFSRHVRSAVTWVICNSQRVWRRLLLGRILGDSSPAFQSVSLRAVQSRVATKILSGRGWIVRASPQCTERQAGSQEVTLGVFIFAYMLRCDRRELG
jgi:hypothetical protein